MGTNYLKELMLISASVAVGFGGIAIYSNYGKLSGLSSPGPSKPPQVADVKRGQSNTSAPTQSSKSQKEIQLEQALTEKNKERTQLEQLKQENENLQRERLALIREKANLEAKAPSASKKKELGKGPAAAIPATANNVSSSDIAKAEVRKKLYDSMKQFSSQPANTEWPVAGVQLFSDALVNRKTTLPQSGPSANEYETGLESMARNGMEYVRANATREGPVERVARVLHQKGAHFLSNREISELKDILKERRKDSAQAKNS